MTLLNILNTVKSPLLLCYVLKWNYQEWNEHRKYYNVEIEYFLKNQDTAKLFIWCELIVYFWMLFKASVVIRI